MARTPPRPPIMAGNARGKKTRAPGYKPGGYWALCDICGCAIRASEGHMRWDGYFVCPDDWEARHEQDFLRARTDRIAPQGPVRPDEGDGDTFIPSFCSTNTCITEVAIADCAICDNVLRQAYSSQIPDSTFGSGL